MRIRSLYAALVAAGLLAACGGGGGGDAPAATTLVAKQDLSAPLAAANAQALAGQSFSFPRGVPAFDTRTATMVALTSSSSFAVGSVEGSANGSLGFGSCNFTASDNASFPAGKPLAPGSTVRVNPCTAEVGTLGQAANGQAVMRDVVFVLAGQPSEPKGMPVVVSDKGLVSINGIPVGTVAVGPLSGGS